MSRELYTNLKVDRQYACNLCNKLIGLHFGFCSLGCKFNEILIKERPEYLVLTTVTEIVNNE